ncbi:MAG: hypothetical protein AB1757_25285 [Acidobacteriota bacterium]
MQFAKKKALILAAIIVTLPSVVAFYVYWRAVAQPMRKPTSAERFGKCPNIILWAWERPEDLRFINPREVGVAILTNTIHLKGEETFVRPRLQPLQISKDAFVISVTRIETDRQEKPSFSDEQRKKVLAKILATINNPLTSGVQVDFDARESEREFYRQLLKDLRKELPTTMPLSITALASWCLYDNWISDLPVDEAVPMLFRLGADEKQIRAHIENGGDFREPLAAQSLGIATDEPFTRLPASRRVYIFSNRAWDQATAQPIIEEVKRWQ